MSSVGCAGTRENEGMQLTVMTYNIHHGEGTDGRLDLERIARIIAAEKPDFVAVQEVDHLTQRTGQIDQARELGRLTGMNHIFGKAMDYQGGAYGQAILSKWPILEHQVHTLPQRDGREPRIALSAEVAWPGRKLTFVSTHLDHQLEEVRQEQAKTLRRLFTGGSPGSIILAGDFNARPESETIRILSPAWADAAARNPVPTIPAGQPTRRIDYIFLSPPERWTVVRTRVLEEPVASDHRPVLAVLKPAP